MKKKLILIASLFSVAIICYFIYQKNNTTEQWQTFNKVNHDLIQSYPTTKKEQKKYKLPVASTQAKKRKPASLKPTSEPTKRAVVNPTGKKIDPNQKTVNEVNKEWKERLGQNLLRFLRPETLVFVKKQKSVTLVEDNLLRNAEVVIIQLKSPEGRRYSYNAYVDSETGKVLQTWNRTIHEFFGKKQKKLAPSGIINESGTTRF